MCKIPSRRPQMRCITIIIFIVVIIHEQIKVTPLQELLQNHRTQSNIAHL